MVIVKITGNVKSCKEQKQKSRGEKRREWPCCKCFCWDDPKVGREEASQEVLSGEVLFRTPARTMHIASSSTQAIPPLVNTNQSKSITQIEHLSFEMNEKEIRTFLQRSQIILEALFGTI